MSKLSDKIGQFTVIPNSVIKLWPQLGLNAFALFVCLRYHSNDNDVSFPSYDRITQETTLNRRAIAKAIRDLESAGLLTRKRRWGNSTIYTLQMPSISSNSTLMPLVAKRDYSSSESPLSLVSECTSNQTHLTRLIKSDPINGEKEIAIEKDVSSEKPDPKQELRPSTEGGSLLLEKLSSEQRARGRAAVKYFETLVQKQAFEAAEVRLGLAELEKAMNKGLQTGLRDRSRLINYIVKWNPGRVWNQPTFETGQPMIIQARD